MNVPTPNALPGSGGGGALSRLGGGLIRGQGAYQALNPNLPVDQRLLGGITTVNPLLGGALTLGAVLGTAAQKYLPESDYVSGRGSGSQALVGKKQRAANSAAMAGTWGNKTAPQFADIRGSKTPGSMTPADDNSAADLAFQRAEEFQRNREKPTGGKGPAANEFVGREDEAMAIWAKANPTLAAKVKPGQSGYAAIQKALGRKTEAEKYNEIETFKSTDEGVTNPAIAAKAAGIETLYDAQTDPQAFLSNAIGEYNFSQKLPSMFGEDVKPIVSMGSPLVAANYENQVTPVSQMYDNVFDIPRGLNLRTGGTDTRPLTVSPSDIPRGEGLEEYFKNLDAGKLTRQNI